MIKLTRLNESEIYVNENYIFTAEEAPDTIITMQNGHRFSVSDGIDSIIREAYENKGFGTFVILTRLNKEKSRILMNADFFEAIEEVPDTVITMQNTFRYTVSEPAEDILRKADEYKKGIFN